MTSISAPSALQSLLTQHLPPSSVARTSTTTPYHDLALQIQHNLQHQHHWTHLQLHTRSPLSSHPLPRPLLSGLPPKRLYIHPDEQDEFLRQETERRRQRESASATEAGDDEDEGQHDAPTPQGEARGQDHFRPEREWVLPTHLREPWTLRRMADVFDAIGPVPPAPDADGAGAGAGAAEGSRWRQTKRVVLATLDDDSTVVYYVVHDGIVKPRQN